MKYAVEVAKAGSLNKASEELLIAPPNLSRSITKRGEEFMHYAKKILEQIEVVENNFRTSEPAKKQFSISVPRASYISDAFIEFSSNIGNEPIEIYYKETNPYRAIKNILEVDYKLGIVRYATCYDKYYTEMFEEKGLAYELIVQFHYVLIMNKNSQLANKEEIHFDDLRSFIEIAHADPFVPSIPLSIVKKEELPDNIERRIFIFERGTQFDLLANNPDTFMWVSPIPERILDCHGLIQRECPDNSKAYKDVLIYRKNYELTQLDRQFIVEVHKSIRNNFY